MRREMKATLIIIILAGFTFILTSGYAQMRMMGRNVMMNRHHASIPKIYKKKSNTVPKTEENLKEGATLYQSYCVSCHGDTGKGDGIAGKELNPRPANIAWSTKMPMASDRYLLWTISEGGAAFGSAMPPFKDALKEEEIWKIVHHIRGL